VALLQKAGGNKKATKFIPSVTGFEKFNQQSSDNNTGFVELVSTGLSILVQESFGLDLFNHCLYVFCNRNRDKLKILHWEDSGFWLYKKRLEKGGFKWPGKSKETNSLEVSERELNWLLDGLILEQKPVTERLII